MILTGSQSNLANIISTPKDLLPELREDLQLLAASDLDDGSPSWTIHDPLRQKFYKIGWQEFEILSRWQLKDVSEITHQVNRQTTLCINDHHVEEVCNFLKIHSLVKTDNSEQIYQRYLASNNQDILSSLLRNYLFFRIPLLRPDNFLSATLPIARFFFSPAFWSAVILTGLFSAYLTMRQWDSFQQTFIYFFSLEGLIYYGAALTITKAIHELGHAYTAKRYGLNVPTMGIAFILLWPILYTDTTDAWRLASKSQRLKIGFAGMLMEICTAVAATFLWNFLPEGPAKSAVFFLATTTWLVTISVNLNPLMRFDGYYILSDLLEVPNLQKQAFDLAKWRLRKFLFGLKEQCPINVPLAKKRILLLYAYSTWTYRFFLFLGIALLVYHFTFKILGIFLMAVEITMFITMPILREVKHWWNSRAEIGLNIHLFSTFFFLATLIFLALFPWPTIIHMPATYGTASYLTVYPPQNGKVTDIKTIDNDLVTKGDPLFTIYSPDLSFQLEQTAAEVDILKLQLKKVISSLDSEDQIQVVQKKLTEKLTLLKGQQTQLNQLKVVAPKSGRVFMQNPIALKKWVNKKEPLLALIDEKEMKAEGYVDEQNFHNVKIGDFGLFYPESLEVPPIEVYVENIDHLDTKNLPKPYLASVYGGNIPVELSTDGKLATHSGYYRVIMRPAVENTYFPRVIRGSVRIDGKSQNLFRRIWPKIAAVFIRESGF